MIRAIVSGASGEIGAEVIRIIINHPDVHIHAALDTRLSGQKISEHITGLFGETDLAFSETADTAKADVVFICDSTPLPFNIDAPENDHLRIIDLSSAVYSNELWVQGICELNRKAMVRGAKRVYVPTPHSILAATALLPAAKNLMLNAPITLAFNDELSDNRVVTTEQLRRALSTLQNSFNASITSSMANAQEYNSALTQVRGADNARFAQVVVMTAMPLDARHLMRMYNEYFEDHNFVHLIDRDAVAADVVNTNKCLLHVSTDGRTMRVHAAFDPRLHGSAGTAVHAMNLLFGLHELTGLQLKALA